MVRRHDTEVSVDIGIQANYSIKSSEEFPDKAQ